MDASNPSSHSMETKGADMRSRFVKRKRTLLRKAYEVSTLCDVDCCIIISSPFDNSQVTWPTEYEQVEKVIAKFQNMPEMERTRKMKTPEKFYNERVLKLQEKMKRLQRDNRRKEVAGSVSRWLAGHKDQELDVDDLKQIDLYLKAKLNVLSTRIEVLKKQVPLVEQPVVLSTQSKSKGVAPPEEQPKVDEAVVMAISGGQPGSGDSDSASASLDNP